MKPIWDKGLGVSGKRQNIKQEIKQICSEIDEEGENQAKDIGLIEAADNALKNRVVQRDQMQKFIEKKREMFLMQMTIDQKKDQIKQLEELINIKNQGLVKAEENIKKDLSTFNDHLKRNKNEATTLNDQASEVADKKNQASKRLKIHKDKKANEISLNTKELEKLDQLLRYKDFLDKLADTNQESGSTEDEFKIIEANPVLKEAFMEYRKFYPASLLRLPMLRLLLDPCEIYRPSFNTADDIEKKFIDMEEQSLRLIRDRQDAENEKDDLDEKFRIMNAKYDEEISSLEEKKKKLERSKAEKEAKIAELEKIKIGSVNEIKSGSAKLFEEIKKACKVMQPSKEMPALVLMTVSYCESRNLKDGSRRKWTRSTISKMVPKLMVLRRQGPNESKKTMKKLKGNERTIRKKRSRTMRRREPRDIKAGETCTNHKYLRKKTTTTIIQMKIEKIKSIKNSSKNNTHRTIFPS